MGQALPTSRPRSPFILTVGWLCVIPAAAVGVAVLSAPWWWLGDLGTPWSTHAAVLLLVPLVLWRRWAPMAWALAALFVILLMPRLLSAWSARALPLPEAVNHLTVAAWNVYKDNPMRAGDVPGIAALASDVLGLIEIDQGDEDSLAADPRWPYQHWEHGGSVGYRGFGSAVLSRYPLTDVVVHRLTSDVLIEATISVKAAPIRIFVVHTMAPGSAERSRLRARQMEAIARLVRSSSEPIIALGDWNCTPACRVWQSVHHAGLRRARQPAAATWPAALGPFGIAIDHVLTRDADVIDAQARTLDGSDHRLIEAVIGW